MSGLPDQFTKIISSLAAFPTQSSVIKLTVGDWEKAYKDSPVTAWLDLAAGALNLFSQYQDIVSALSPASRLIPGVAYLALGADLANAYNQVKTTGKISDSTILNISADIAGIVSSHALTFATAAAGPELLALGVIAGAVSIALASASYVGVDLTPIFNELKNLRAAHTTLYDTLEAGVFKAISEGDGTVLGGFAAIQGAPVREGGLDKVLSKFAEPSSAPPVVPTAGPSIAISGEYAPAENVMVYLLNQPARITLASSFAGASTIRASAVGQDLVIKSTNNQITIKDWKEGHDFTIVLPDGNTLSNDYFENAFTHAQERISFSQNYYGVDFVNVVNSLGVAFSLYNSCSLDGGLASVWSAGLLYGNYIGQSTYNTPIYSWSLGTSSATPEFLAGNVSVDAVQARAWGAITYNFWQNLSGQYEFAITQQSSGQGGQYVTRWNPISQQEEYFYVEKTVLGYSSQGHAITRIPAVTSVDIVHAQGDVSEGVTHIIGNFSKIVNGVHIEFNIDYAGNVFTTHWHNGIVVKQSQLYVEGYETVFTFSQDGVLSSFWSKHPDGSVSYSLNGSNGSRTDYRIEATGEIVVYEITTEGASRQQTYDATGKLLFDRATSAAGAYTSYRLDDAGSKYFSTYNGLGLTIEKIIVHDGTIQTTYFDSSKNTGGFETVRLNGFKESWAYSPEEQVFWISDGLGFSSKTTTQANGDQVVSTTNYGLTQVRGNFSDGSFF